MVTGMGENVFRILEIEPTNDKKEIKKAYAGLVKRYHPEEFPEEWKKIHDAYEQALKMAEHVQPKMSPEPPVKIEVLEPQVQEREPEAEPSEPTGEEEMESLFDNIEELSREQQNQKKEERKKAVDEAIDILRPVYYTQLTLQTTSRV